MSEEGDYSLVHFLEREQTKENTLAAYKAGLEAGAARAAPKWIKCSERLPMENEIKPDPRNFRDENGKLFMIYCPKCKLENYAPSVADGQCAWCGYKEEKKAREWWEVRRGNSFSLVHSMHSSYEMAILGAGEFDRGEYLIVHVREVLSNGK